MALQNFFSDLLVGPTMVLTIESDNLRGHSQQCPSLPRFEAATRRDHSPAADRWLSSDLEVPTASSVRPPSPPQRRHASRSRSRVSRPETRWSEQSSEPLHPHPEDRASPRIRQSKPPTLPRRHRDIDETNVAQTTIPKVTTVIPALSTMESDPGSGYLRPIAGAA